MNTAAVISTISPKLTKMAAAYSHSTYESQDDLYQSMVVHLLERQAENPTFFEQKESYILDAGRKGVCWAALRKAQTRDKYFTEVPDTADEFEDDYFDTFLSDEPNPEVACENLEDAIRLAGIIRDDLSGREREVLSLVVAGNKTSTIAAKLGVSSAAVSVYKSRIVGKILEA